MFCFHFIIRCTIDSGYIDGNGLVLAAMEVQGGKRSRWGQWRWEAFALSFGSDGSVGVCVGGDVGAMCLPWCWQHWHNGGLHVLMLALAEVGGVCVGTMELGGVVVGVCVGVTW